MTTPDGKYKKPKPTEAGKRIKYDVKQMRIVAHRIERWITQRDAPPEIEKRLAETANWENLKRYIKQAIRKLLPQDN